MISLVHCKKKKKDLKIDLVQKETVVCQKTLNQKII